MSDTATSRRLFSSRESITLAIFLLLAAVGVSSTITIKAALYQNEVTAVLAQSGYSEALAQNVRGQLQDQSATISSIRSKLIELTSPSVTLGSTELNRKAGAILNQIDDVDRTNKNSEEGVRMLYDNIRALNPPRPTALNFASSANAAEQKKGDKSAPTVVQTPTPLPSVQTPTQPPSAVAHPSKMGDLRWFLWALLGVPFFMGLIALYHINSANQKAQDFCIATVGGVLGYYFGLGSSAFAVVLG